MLSLFDSHEAMCSFTQQYFNDVISHATDESSSASIAESHTMVTGLARALAMAASVDGLFHASLLESVC